MLAVPDLDKKKRIEVDTSDYATEKVLSMKCKDGKWKLVAFLSKSLNETKRNYEIHDKEMLAVISVRVANIGFYFILFYFSFSFWFILYFEN